MIPDYVNGTFELFGTLFILLSVRQLWLEKLVRGVSYWHIGFFTAWGFWNLFYYPHLGQWWSFVGGMALVWANAIYLTQIIYYTRTERRRFYNEPKDYA